MKWLKALSVGRSIKRTGLYATKDNMISREHLYAVKDKRPHIYAINDHMISSIRHKRLYDLIYIHHQLYYLIYMPSKIILPYLCTKAII